MIKKFNEFNINENDNSIINVGGNQVKGHRYVDSELEKERLAKFDIKRAYIEQIPEIIDAEDGEKIIGSYIDDRTNEVTALTERNGKLGLLYFKYKNGKFEAYKTISLHSHEELQELIDKYGN